MQHSLEWQLFHKKYICAVSTFGRFSKHDLRITLKVLFFVQSLKNIVNIGVDLFKIAYTLASAVAISGKENS